MEVHVKDNFDVVLGEGKGNDLLPKKFFGIKGVDITVDYHRMLLGCVEGKNYDAEKVDFFSNVSMDYESKYDFDYVGATQKYCEHLNDLMFMVVSSQYSVVDMAYSHGFFIKAFDMSTEVVKKLEDNQVKNN